MRFCRDRTLAKLIGSPHRVDTVRFFAKTKPEVNKQLRTAEIGMRSA